MSRKTFDSTEYHKSLKAWDKVHCLNCGAELPKLSERKDRAGSRSNLSKCCNQDCKKAWLKRVLHNWAELRLDIIKRDSYTCQDCGYKAPMGFNWEFNDYNYKDLEKFGPMPRHVSWLEWKFMCGLKAHVTKKWQTDKGLEVHHITPIKDGGDEWDENNLVTLCVECHDLRHAGKPKLPKLTKEEKQTLQIVSTRKLHISLDRFAEA